MAMAKLDFEAIWLFGLSGMGLLVACSAQPRPIAPDPSGQSYRDAIQQICDSDRALQLGVDTNELLYEEQLVDYWIANTKNADAIYFLTIFRTKSPSDKAAMLKHEATAQGIANCTLAARLEAAPI